jgi:protocatechuate 3,4-dioxygenase beta subunit
MDGSGTVRERKLSRRRALGMLGVTGAAFTLARCGGSPTSPSTTAGAATTAMSGTGTTIGTGTTTGSACAVTPSETEGPFPSLTSLLRSDIREGRAGTPVNLTITVVNTNSGCGPVANASVDIWQCDAAGDYSEYGTQRAETYLRGTQVTNSSGTVNFTTIYPGWYQGRATHIHVEVTVNGRSVKVTQIAFPENITNAVYSSGVYASRGQNPTSNLRDMVFADTVASELATVTGDPATGYAASFIVGIAI